MIHLREQYWAVEVPEDFTMANIWNNQVCSGELVLFPLPAGNWQIVCTSKEVTEEQAAGVVEQEGIGYKDYTAGPPENDYGDFVLSSDSLDSLLTSKGCYLKLNWLILKKQDAHT